MKKRIKYIIFFVLFVTLPVCFGTLIVGIIQLKKSYDISGNLNKYKLYDSVVDTISTLVTDGSASATYYIEIKEKKKYFWKGIGTGFSFESKRTTEKMPRIGDLVTVWCRDSSVVCFLVKENDNHLVFSSPITLISVLYWYIPICIYIFLIFISRKL